MLLCPAARTPAKGTCPVYSNSTVPVGFGVKSYSTRLIPGTSSLNRIRTGSTNSKFISSGSPPTLWCALMPSSDSRMSGQMVPCARNSMPSSFLAYSANTSINSFPMIILFFSGSSTPASLSGYLKRSMRTVNGLILLQNV